jgi:hypothetical protein
VRRAFTPPSTQQKRLKMRQDGYADGRAGRPARHLDAEYQASYRRGLEARRLDQEGRLT